MQLVYTKDAQPISKTNCCRQIKKCGKVESNSYAKHNICNPSFEFQHLKHTGLGTIKMKHCLYHNTIEGIVEPAGLRAFVGNR